MKHFTITITLLILCQLSIAQSNPVQKIISQIEYQEDTVKAVFDWVTDNISYDVNKLNEMQNGKDFYKEGNFNDYDEYQTYLIKKVIKDKKGVCDDYSLLFKEIVTELGYDSHMIGGITKGQNGRVGSGAGHSWISVKVDGEWKLYDPTWGSGHLNSEKQFVKKYYEKWYAVDPEKMRESHLPFDPIWQLSEKIMTFNEFAEGVNPANSEPAIDFSKMIEKHLQLDDEAKNEAELERLLKYGGDISPFRKQEKVLLSRRQYYARSKNYELINSTLASHENSAKQFRAYMAAKKNRFTDTLWTIEYAQDQLLEIKEHLIDSNQTFDSIVTKDPKVKHAFEKYGSQSKTLLKMVNKELLFIKSKL